MDKKSLSERDICTKFITPAIKKTGGHFSLLQACAQKLLNRLITTLPSYLYFIESGALNHTSITLFRLQHRIYVLSEQQRIVTKLEQLMQLCSEVEKNINQSKEETNLLLQTVLREALEEKEK